MTARPANALDPHKLISQYSHSSWTAKDGIPGAIRAVVQTPDGYLWLGTQAGLYRFDGLRSVPLADELSDAPRAAVTSLCVARDGSLWISFGSGVITRLHHGRVTNFEPGEGLPNAGMRSIAQDSSGTLWAAGPYGFCRFDGRAWRRVGAEHGYEARGAQTILVDHHGTLWVVTDGFNFQLGHDSSRENTILALDVGARRFRPTKQAVGMVWSMVEAADGEIWIAETNGPLVRPLRNRNRSAIGARGTRALLLDRNGGLWIAAFGALLRVSSADPAASDTADTFTVTDGLSGSSIYAALEDREGNVWFGTSGGLDRFRDTKAVPLTTRHGLAIDQLLSLAATSDGSVWMTPYSSDVVQRIRAGRVSVDRLHRYEGEVPRILSMGTSQKGELIFGGSFMLAQMGGSSVRYERVPVRPGQPTPHVEALAEDSEGALWIAGTTAEGVGRIWRRLRGRWTDLSDSPALPRYRCRVLHADRAGRMWFGYENGDLVVYDRRGFRRYASDEGLPGARILTIASDRMGHLWVGGEGGLSRLTDHGFVRLTERNGLPGNALSAFIEDQSGDVWIAGTLGVLRVSPRELEACVAAPSHRMQGALLDVSDGLPGFPRQGEPYPSAVRSADGRLWFSTSGGVAVIDPHRLPRNTLAPPVIIESVHADDRPVELAGAIRLRPLTKRVDIGYTALCLSVPERVEFRYKLDGYDKAWRGPLRSREATYTNLPHGNYRFRLQASNNDGVWNEAGTALAFTILPAFFETTWFYGLVAVGAGWFVWAAYRWRIRQVIQVMDRRFQERLSERTRIAQDLHDTLLQSVMSASMQLHVAVDELPEPGQAGTRLRRVVQLMGEVASEGRRAVEGLRLVDLESRDLAEALSEVHKDSGMAETASFRALTSGATRPLHPGVRDEVFRVGREAVLNALRHSGAGAVEVAVEYAPRELRMTVTDNGRGISEDVLRSGRTGHWGMTGMRERADQMGARLAVRSRTGSGTEVELIVPGSIAYKTGPGKGLLGQWTRWRRRARDARSTNSRG